MRLPNAEKTLVEREKITESLLSTTNPSGRSKAFFFLRFGFSADSWEVFAEALSFREAPMRLSGRWKPSTVRATTWMVLLRRPTGETHGSGQSGRLIREAALPG